MKKLRSLYKPYLLRPILYRCTTKFAVSLTLVLLWCRYINCGVRPAVRDGAFAAALCLFAAAWFSYLKLDGLKFYHAERPPKKRHISRSIADYADQHIVSFGELTDNERSLCGVVSSLMPGLLFLIAAVTATFMP